MSDVGHDKAVLSEFLAYYNKENSNLNITITLATDMEATVISRDLLAKTHIKGLLTCIFLDFPTVLV